MGEENLIVDRLARMEEKLDNVLKIIPDHETRLRGLEQKKEECQQVDTLSDIRDQVGDHETRINGLEKTHDKDEGAQTATRTTLEYVLAIITIAEGLIIIWQFFGGPV